MVYELNIDGLVGPTHNYAGLAAGNIASTQNALTKSNPRAAALQGLAKMQFLHQLGFKQAFLPPHQRPNLELLYKLGFTGSINQQLNAAKRQAPELLSAAYSASSMWTANAATVSPSSDTADKRVHFTVANLVSNLHRHQEASFTESLLKRLFSSEKHFYHHPILPASLITSDEGAANHNRLASSHAGTGLHLFIYGKQALAASNRQITPQQFPARQTLEASSAIARAHGLDPNNVLFLQQNPRAIDQGVFHHDVIGVANESVIFLHEWALVNQQETLLTIRNKVNFPLTLIEVSQNELSIEEVVNSYLFNSQLLTKPDGNMMLLTPKECEENEKVHRYLQALLADPANPINECYYLDVKQSMRNGGGPACLRLRVVLNEEELAAMKSTVLLSEALISQLEQWINRHYRECLSDADFADPSLAVESMTALDELSRLLELGNIYPFQRE